MGDMAWATTNDWLEVQTQVRQVQLKVVEIETVQNRKLTLVSPLVLPGMDQSLLRARRNAC